MDELIDALIAEHQTEQLAALAEEAAGVRPRAPLPVHRTTPALHRTSCCGSLRTLALALGCRVAMPGRSPDLLLIRALGVSRPGCSRIPSWRSKRSAMPGTYGTMLERRLARRAGRLHPRRARVLRARLRGHARCADSAARDRAAGRAGAGAHSPKTSRGRCSTSAPGSGCIAVTLAPRCARGLRVVATDVSEAALAVARQNARRHRVHNVELRVGSWFEPVAGERFD